VDPTANLNSTGVFHQSLALANAILNAVGTPLLERRG
jgi:hypothetical protein